MKIPFSKPSAPAVPKYIFEAELGDGRIVDIYANTWTEAISQTALKYNSNSLCSLKLIGHRNK